MVIRKFAAPLVASLLAVAGGCAGPAGGETRAVVPAPAAGATIDRARPAQSLYVANLYTNDGVAIFGPNRNVPQYALTNARACDHPVDMALDKAGYVYVTDFGGTVCEDLEVYVPGSTRPSKVVASRGFAPVFVSVAPGGDVYVAAGESRRYPRGVVIEFAPGAARVLREITQGICEPKRPVFDARGNVYVANEFCGIRGAGSIVEYAPGGMAPFRRITKGIFHPQSIAIDGSGNLFAAQYYNNSVVVYAPGSVEPLRTLHPGTGRHGAGPVYVACDSKNRVYVANSTVVSTGGSVTVYAPAGATLLWTLVDQIENPSALAFDSGGRLYVANGGPPGYGYYGWISVYGLGERSAQRIVTAGVAQPVALAIGAR